MGDSNSPHNERIEQELEGIVRLEHLQKLLLINDLALALNFETTGSEVRILPTIFPIGLFRDHKRVNGSSIEDMPMAH